MQKSKLTVVTTTYNQEKFIKDCIEGIVNQKTSFPFQLIISDDCSTDETRNIIKEYQKKYPDIVKPIFREKNLGAMGNFVQTLNEVHTEYVALCDGDDYWTDMSKLQKQVDFLDKNKDYTICYHLTKVVFEDNSEEPSVYPLCDETEQTFKDLLSGNNIPANTVVYRWLFKDKDSFIKEFPDDIIPGDYYVHLMHGRKGKIHLINKQMSIYRRQKDGMWYETIKSGPKIDFYIKNGIKIINFYVQAEKNLEINNDDFDELCDYAIIDVLNAAFRTCNYDIIGKLVNNYYNDKVYLFKEYSFDLSWIDRYKYNKMIKRFIK